MLQNFFLLRERSARLNFFFHISVRIAHYFKYRIYNSISITNLFTLYPRIFYIRGKISPFILVSFVITKALTNNMLNFLFIYRYRNIY
ncbi:hypothetical protein RhiirB3_254673 [Rhizophagus irregularis]|nr:hypothetical protein RhiirB3_254673 [Rhizophagus irregularis]